MPKFAVYALYHASKYIGEYEAENEEDAIEKAGEDADGFISLCHQCAGEVEIGDLVDFHVEKNE